MYVFGITPNSKIVEKLCTINEFGEIITDEFMCTSDKNIYAIGDVRNTEIRQVITGMSDAVYAVKHIGENI